MNAEPQTEAGRALLDHHLVRRSAEIRAAILAIEEEAADAARHASDAQVSARFVATSWRDAVMASETLRATGMSHPLAMVLAALDGETDPARLGLPDDQYEAFRAALAAPAPQPATSPLNEGGPDGLRLHDDARRDLVPRSPEDVIRALARESLAHRDEYASEGYLMEPMPFEAEVRARLAEPRSPSQAEPETGG